MSEDINADVDRAWAAHHQTAPAPVARVMRNALPQSTVPTRMVLMPVYLHLPNLATSNPGEQLAELRRVKEVIEGFCVHMGLEEHSTQPSLRRMESWRKARKEAGVHIADYEYLFLKAFRKFECKVDTAIAALEEGKPATLPLPYSILLPLHKGYHTLCPSDKTASELMELYDTLSVLHGSITTVIQEHGASPFLSAFNRKVDDFRRDINLRSFYEHLIEPTIESQLPQGTSEEHRLASTATGHVEQLLQRMATSQDQGRSS